MCKLLNQYKIDNFLILYLNQKSNVSKDVVKVKRADHYLPIFSLKSIKTKLIYKHMYADSPNESFTNNEFIKKIQMLCGSTC